MVPDTNVVRSCRFWQPPCAVRVSIPRLLTLGVATVCDRDTDCGDNDAGYRDHALHAESLAEQQGADQRGYHGFQADDNAVGPVRKSLERGKFKGKGHGGRQQGHAQARQLVCGAF